MKRVFTAVFLIVVTCAMLSAKESAKKRRLPIEGQVVDKDPNRMVIFVSTRPHGSKAGAYEIQANGSTYDNYAIGDRFCFLGTTADKVVKFPPSPPVIFFKILTSGLH